MILSDITSEIPYSMSSVYNFVIDGGIFMFCLILLSIVSVTVIILKGLTLRVSKIIPQPVQRAMKTSGTFIDEDNISSLTDCLRSHKSPLSRIGLGVIVGAPSNRVEASSTAEAKAREEIVIMERGIALLEVVITIAPLLGLLGTVSGLVGVFSNVDLTEAGSSRVAVSRGIAEALNTTIAGLAVAVPTVIAHSYFTKKIERFGVRMEVLTDTLITAFYKNPSEVLYSKIKGLVSDKTE